MRERTQADVDDTRKRLDPTCDNCGRYSIGGPCGECVKPMPVWYAGGDDSEPSLVDDESNRDCGPVY